MGYKMSNMTLDEAIEHCKKVAKEQENCNVGCSLEHRQLAIWLSATSKTYCQIKTNNKHYGNKLFLCRENQQETEKQNQVSAYGVYRTCG